MPYADPGEPARSLWGRVPWLPGLEDMMTAGPVHLSMDALEAGLDLIRDSPADRGVLHLIVRRPRMGEREILEQGRLDPADGLVGDSWRARAARASAGSPSPDTQINVMNARVAALVAQEVSRWALAGDQLFIDLDLSEANLPSGTRLALGSAIVEITDEPHTGCSKFAARFGMDAMRFVNSPVGRRLRLRGINAKVVQVGTIRVGDVVSKASSVVSSARNRRLEVP